MITAIQKVQNRCGLRRSRHNWAQLTGGDWNISSWRSRSLSRQWSKSIKVRVRVVSNGGKAWQLCFHLSRYAIVLLSQNGNSKCKDDFVSSKTVIGTGRLMNWSTSREDHWNIYQAYLLSPFWLLSIKACKWPLYGNIFSAFRCRSNRRWSWRLGVHSIFKPQIRCINTAVNWGPRRFDWGVMWMSHRELGKSDRRKADSVLSSSHWTEVASFRRLRNSGSWVLIMSHKRIARLIERLSPSSSDEQNLSNKSWRSSGRRISLLLWSRNKFTM